MDLYTIDEGTQFRRKELIEHYESFIWTDRYSQYGDFSLKCEPTKAMYDQLKPDTLIGFSESDRLMRIETIKRSQDKQGKNSFQIEGKSVEAVLEGRAAKKVLTPATWDFTGSIGSIVTSIVSQICIQGLGPTGHDDDIYGLTVSDLTGVATSYTVKVKSGTIYERIKELCDTFDFGFRITCVPGSDTLKFAIYNGTDRTGPSGVTFSPLLENLSETSYVESKADYKTGAYVFSNFGAVLVGTTGDAGLLSLKRRILLVDATDVAGPYDAAHDAAIKQRGRDALSEHMRVTLYDGVVNPSGASVYNTHYFLGDKVTLIGDYGVPQNMRVTEHIWSVDASGANSYPTLSVIGGV